jgi:hypothetical protein
MSNNFKSDHSKIITKNKRTNYLLIIISPVWELLRNRPVLIPRIKWMEIFPAKRKL